MFPPTFLYTQSWEDPRPDMEVCSSHSLPLSNLHSSAASNCFGKLGHGC